MVVDILPQRPDRVRDADSWRLDCRLAGRDRASVPKAEVDALA
jgi:hypothetical protein